MSRKIFNYDRPTESKIIESLSKKLELYENSVSACGCLFYRINKKNDNKLQLLLISYPDPNWPKFDDFGGRIDDTDNSIHDAISRETSEESNGVITEEFMKEMLLDIKPEEIFYTKQSKYYSVVKKVDRKFFTDTTVFGDFEQTDKINRTIHWIDYDVAKPKLAMRLAGNLKLINFLDSVAKEAE